MLTDSYSFEYSSNELINTDHQDQEYTKEEADSGVDRGHRHVSKQLRPGGEEERFAGGRV